VEEVEREGMKSLARGLGLTALLIWTLILNLYHAGVYPPPFVDFSEKAKGQWIDRREAGINNMILEGPAFARGRASGELTGPLLLAEEEQLISQLQAWIPSNILIQGVVLGAIAWFQGADKYIDTPSVQEMYGVSLSAPKSFDYLADGFTRQLAYHGLHEVGQMMVDQGFEDMGCTVVAVPFKNTFMIGRNFDFEGGRIFDSEKILKWVFPDKGYAFASVIWAGMVGAVTGVNEKGLYISLNAGGSSDTRRLGTPTTLVVVKILQEAADAQEAIKILEAAQVFITDIYVIMDQGGHLVRVEKSPARMAVVPLLAPSIVTNHLISDTFANDVTNQFRIRELTSAVREKRGLDRLKEITPSDKAGDVELQVLSILRDKGVDGYGQSLNLGNRRAIDSLIATHSVIYNPVDGIFFVGTGPAVSGAFLGYDLKLSFAAHKPVRAGELPADPLVPPATFNSVKDANLKISRAHHLIQSRECREGMAILEDIPLAWKQQSPFYAALGDGEECLGNHEEARADWNKALGLNPAYLKFERQLEKSLQK
jgi:isopenicillin-N N-acyltransferase-like protein